MEGISKEKLVEIKELRRDGTSKLFMHTIIRMCKELDPWLPIENAPWNKPLLVYYPTMEEGLRQRVICRRVNWDSALHKPTHYKELPEDPEE